MSVASPSSLLDTNLIQSVKFREMETRFYKIVSSKKPCFETGVIVMIHYCQKELVVIEFTGRGPRTRKEKSSAKASDFFF